MMENARVIKQVLCEVVRCGDVPQTHSFGNGHVVVYQSLTPKAYRITVEEVEPLPEVKVGQTWRRNADGASFLVVEAGKSEIVFLRMEEWQVRPIFKVPAPLSCNDYTLIQDVVEVVK